MNVTDVYSNDAMLTNRQISKGVKINNLDEDSLINGWNYFQIPRAVVTHGRVVSPG